jgi:hypothetical protein
MPLNHEQTKEAFNENVRRELAAGKTLKQALAIAYSLMRLTNGSFNK